ncbi:hypothetical protein R1flu_027301 [Riccia fluitans]|uniref:Plastocyanin-like domain-containing protein n=1 Tax=Riccia fluitans TaxID=41844 RepID=A0ABD1XMH2_9MARC
MADVSKFQGVVAGRMLVANCKNYTHLNEMQVSFFISALFLLLSSGRADDHFICQPDATVEPSPSLTPFVDPLPIPATIDASSGRQITIGAYKITQVLHRDLPATTLYAYGTSEATATYPGPTLVAKRNIPSCVRFENHIYDSETFLVTDKTLPWANPANGGVPIVPHLHGAEVESASDGHPDAWFTASGEQGPKFVTQNYNYPNSQPSTLLWYHDHTVGITRNNVLAGLTGLYFIRSIDDDPAYLRRWTNEIPLVIQDKRFWANGSISFPDVGVSPHIHPYWCQGYSGDVVLVNGKIWPYLAVHPEKYRFRILNAANARFFTLTLSDADLKWIQIGTDGGFLPSPIYLSELTLAPANRADVIIDFSNLTVGSIVYMNNSAPIPFPVGDPRFSPPLVAGSVMAFKIVSRSRGSSRSRKDFEQWRDETMAQNSNIPTNLTEVPKATYDLATDVYRSFVFNEEFDSAGNRIKSLINSVGYSDPLTETPKLGTVEIWDLINLTPDAHPIHIHLISFLVVHQQALDQAAYTANQCSLEVEFSQPSSCFTEAPQEGNATQVGWKDTVIAYPSVVLRLWIRWTPRDGGSFPFDATSGPGYVWHCHVLEHEDNEMMRPLVVGS